MDRGAEGPLDNDLARAGGGYEDDAFIARLNQALRGMWSRLESLPRSDAFWSRTNHRTTWFKVWDYAQACLERDPSDETARWALAGLCMRGGLFHGLQLLAEDPAAGGETVHHLFAMAEWLWLQVGVEPDARLEQALLRVGPPPVLRGWARSGGRVGRAATAAGALLAGAPFAQAIGRQRWELFLPALLDPTEGCPSSIVDEALLLDDARRCTAARQCLNDDAAAVVDLMDAARWWARYRDTDVVCRLRELLGSVHRGALERLAAERGSRSTDPLRAALLVLDGHDLQPFVAGGAETPARRP